MINALEVGNEVVTAGGILGKIQEMNENYVNLEISENVTISGNRTNRAVTSRDGASAELSDNVTTLSQAEFLKVFSEISDRLGVLSLSK